LEKAERELQRLAAVRRKKIQSAKASQSSWPNKLTESLRVLAVIIGMDNDNESEEDSEMTLNR
jgi:hypothetical protein